MEKISKDKVLIVSFEKDCLRSVNILKASRIDIIPIPELLIGKNQKLI
ncbi:hypothetical protein [Parachlamydia acanthamoebae]|nr:hypothetical protein [Parachlamydia acanthamoebae]